MKPVQKEFFLREINLLSRQRSEWERHKCYSKGVVGSLCGPHHPMCFNFINMVK